MKKFAVVIFGLLAQSPLLLAQSMEVNLPSFDESGLTSFLSSAVLQAVIFVVAGVAAAMALFYLLGNLRMAYDADVPNDGYSSRFPSPTDAGMNLSRGAFGEFVPHFIPVDHEMEEEKDAREETKGQRGD
jgi:hypothetical protein